MANLGRVVFLFAMVVFSLKITLPCIASMNSLFCFSMSASIDVHENNDLEEDFKFFDLDSDLFISNVSFAEVAFSQVIHETVKHLFFTGQHLPQGFIFIHFSPPDFIPVLARS
jgi:hypothetical protein